MEFLAWIKIIGYGSAKEKNLWKMVYSLEGSLYILALKSPKTINFFSWAILYYGNMLLILYNVIITILYYAEENINFTSKSEETKIGAVRKKKEKNM